MSCFHVCEAVSARARASQKSQWRLRGSSLRALFLSHAMKVRCRDGRSIEWFGAAEADLYRSGAQCPPAFEVDAGPVCHVVWVLVQMLFEGVKQFCEVAMSVVQSRIAMSWCDGQHEQFGRGEREQAARQMGKGNKTDSIHL